MPQPGNVAKSLNISAMYLYRTPRHSSKWIHQEAGKLQLLPCTTRESKHPIPGRTERARFKLASVRGATAAHDRV